MKHAFSLLEMIFAIVIFGVLVGILIKPSLEISRFYANFDEKSRILTQINQALILSEKILQNCLEFTLLNDGFECLLKDSQNLILQRENSLFIGFSGILLKNANGEIYAPKSNLIYDFTYLDNKKNPKNAKGGVLVNQNDLHGTNSDFLSIYALEDGTKHDIKPLDEDSLSGFNEDGFYALIDGKSTIKMQKNELIYSYNPANSTQIYDGILVQDAMKFSINESLDDYELEICALKNELCLKRWIKK